MTTSIDTALAATEYLAIGWSLCRVRPGTKMPMGAEWQARPVAVPRAFTSTGIGLIHEHSRTCCLDVDDMPGAEGWLADRGIDLRELLQADDAVRIHSGRPGRAKLLYRLPLGLAALPTRKAVGPGGAMLLELRCAGAQDVLPPSVHPMTGKPYEWAGCGDWRDAPELPADVLRIWETLGPRQPRTDTSATNGAATEIAEGGRNNALASIAGAMRRKGASQGAIAAALLAQNAERCNPPLPEYEVRSIAASVARYPPAPAIDSPATGDLLQREQQRERARRIGEGEPVPTPEVMTLEQMQQQLVYISDGARVAVRGAVHTVLSLADFRLHAAASTMKVGDKYARTVNVWLSDEARITTHTLTFRPGAPEFTTNPDGADALNLWCARKRTTSAADASPFLEHVAYLVPQVDERERFLNWLAHIEQCPGELPHTHYLMVTPMTGIGRNWLASLLARVWPGECRLGFDLVGMFTTGFNGPLSCRTLVIVDELKSADTGYSATHHAQQLKSLLTAEVRTINPKFGRMHHEFNCARWLMLSQHLDALPLEKHDRRIIVVSNPTERHPPDYYRKLYALLDDSHFVAAVAQYLARRDLSGFNACEPAPLTDTKRSAVDACASDIERALVELREGSSKTLMQARDVTDYLAECGLARPVGRALSSAYKAAGLTPCKNMPLIDGKQRRVVALRDGERLKFAPAWELAQLLRDPSS